MAPKLDVMHRRVKRLPDRNLFQSFKQFKPFKPVSDGESKNLQALPL
jgi:hypothetical protein